MKVKCYLENIVENIDGSLTYYLKDDCKDYPTVEQISDFDFSSRSRTIYTGEVFVYQNQQGHFAAIKLGKVDSKSHGRHHDEITFEYKIL